MATIIVVPAATCLLFNDCLCSETLMLMIPPKFRALSVRVHFMSANFTRFSKAVLWKSMELRDFRVTGICFGRDC